MAQTALLVNEIMLHSLVKILAPAGRLLFGSDLPFPFVNRIRELRRAPEVRSKDIKAIYEGKDIKDSYYHDNLMFFVERLANVIRYNHPGKQKEIFEKIFYSAPKSLLTNN